MSIEINTKSWHYRLIAWQNNGRVVNRGLCAYVRKVIACILWVLIGSCAAIATVGGFAFMLLVAPVMLWLMHFGVIPAFEDIVIPALIGHAVWLFTVVGAVIGMYRRQMKERNKDKPKQPSVFVEYIKAKKKKVCPNIEFV